MTLLSDGCHLAEGENAMKLKMPLLIILALVIAAPSWAQYQKSPRNSSQSWGFQQPTHRVEILGYAAHGPS